MFLDSKSWFNYYWNYEIGKEKEKYLYLQLENLLMQMSGHQIYDVKEICRVFYQIEKLMNEDFQSVKLNLQKELTRQSQETYLSSNKDKQKLNSTNKNSTFEKQTNRKNVPQINQPPKLSSSNKRNQLKQKIKSQLDNKYQLQLSNNKIPQKSAVIKFNSQNKEGHLKQSTKNNSKQSVSNFKENFLQKTVVKSKNDSTQIDFRNIFWNSLTFSPSFNSNILMYYVLVLENVIRSEIQLIKNPQFYLSYLKGVQNFIFNPKLQNFLQENSLKHKQSMKKVNEKLERQIYFLNVMRKSLMVSLNKNNEGLSANAEIIDPHKLLTYLINYRHLIYVIDKNKLKDNTEQKETENHVSQRKQSQTIKDLMIRYKKLVDFKANQQNQKYGANDEINKFQDSNKLIKMAMKNKSFIRSLKQLYVQSKKSSKDQSSKDLLNKSELMKNQSKKVKIQKQKNEKFEEIKTQPTYKVIESIFETFDQFYLSQNYKK